MIIQLLNKDTVVYSYNTETKKIDIPSDMLRKQLENGIRVINQNNARSIIKLSDGGELFHKAFEDYFVPSLNQSVFRWQISE